ncbi:hypothetical protein F5Y05DRAFT_47244 [Hypoxylon sp. FL0543]|nr:hypothetical protein F5Y05DRAFT_47244 [Hypoxylon sp. FL0543]
MANVPRLGFFDVTIDIHHQRPRYPAELSDSDDGDAGDDGDDSSSSDLITFSDEGSSGHSPEVERIVLHHHGFDVEGYFLSPEDEANLIEVLGLHGPNPRTHERMTALARAIFRDERGLKALAFYFCVDRGTPSPTQFLRFVLADIRRNGIQGGGFHTVSEVEAAAARGVELTNPGNLQALTTTTLNHVFGVYLLSRQMFLDSPARSQPAQRHSEADPSPSSSPGRRDAASPDAVSPEDLELVELVDTFLERTDHRLPDPSNATILTNPDDIPTVTIIIDFVGPDFRWMRFTTDVYE